MPPDLIHSQAHPLPGPPSPIPPSSPRSSFGSSGWMEESSLLGPPEPTRRAPMTPVERLGCSGACLTRGGARLRKTISACSRGTFASPLINSLCTVRALALDATPFPCPYLKWGAAVELFPVPAFGHRTWGLSHGPSGNDNSPASPPVLLLLAPRCQGLCVCTKGHINHLLDLVAAIAKVVDMADAVGNRAPWDLVANAVQSTDCCHCAFGHRSGC